MLRARLIAAFTVGVMLAHSSALTDGASTQTATRESVELQHGLKSARGGSISRRQESGPVAPGRRFTDATGDDPAGGRAASTTAEGFSQEPLPGDFVEKARRRFDKIKKPEVTFEEYLEFEREESRRLRQLERDPQLRYRPAGRKSSPHVPHVIPACTNGDFETSLDTAQWHGAYGTVPPNGNPVFSSFTAGITPGNSPGPLANANSRQTWVNAGTDPHVGIPQTGPNPSGQASAGAVRIGNASGGSGSELLAKTFTVTSRQVRFWYAVVFHRTPHPLHQVPSFWVRVGETASGNPVAGAVNLGNGADKLVGNPFDPFLKTKLGNTHLYTGWSCARINLPARLLGKNVTVEFVTEDCAQTGHFGYAYIDNFCGTCPGAPH